MNNTTMLTHRTTVKLTDDIFKQLDNLAVKLGETKSGIIRSAIVYYLKDWGGI